MEEFARRLELLCDNAKGNWDWMLEKGGNGGDRAYSAMVMMMSSISEVRVVIEDMREAENKAKIIDLTNMEDD
jgi:hypothetical protein